MTSSGIHQDSRGFTLLELLVVLGIVAVLLAMFLGAVMKVRDIASQAQSKNNLKQIVFALHSYAESNRCWLPLVPISTVVGRTAYPAPDTLPLFVSLLPYLEEANRTRQAVMGPVALFISPADPTAAQGISLGLPLASYAANAQVFWNNPQYPQMPRTFVDGTSNTIAFAEHYAFNCGGYYFDFSTNDTMQANRRATFADYTDIFPVRRGNPPVTGPSEGNYTFQAAPSVAACYSFVAQTPHASGMLVALGDGSVRIISPGISSATYWSAVTPRGGEILGGDWW